MATPNHAPRLAVTAVVLTLVVSVPAWGGPGPAAGSLPWTAGAVAAALAIGVLIWTAPVESPLRRRAWKLFVAGTLLFVAGGLWFRLVYSQRADVPVPSPPDGLFIAAYAAVVLALVVLFYRPTDEAPRSAALDGALLGLAAATVAESTVCDRLFWGGADIGLAGAATALAYPLLSLCFLGTLVAAGDDAWASRQWRWLAVAASTLVVADFAYLRRVADGDLTPGSWYQPLYLLGGLAVAAAAWAPGPVPRYRRVEGVRMILLPGGVAAVAAVILVWDHFEPRSDLAIWLAALTLGAVALRAALTVFYLGQLVDARRLALTDDLTGLPNRRWFIEQLGAAVREAPAGGFAVLLLGIDRFKDLNDTLGHHVGDQVLRDSAARLVSALHPEDVVARLGGDEFAVLPAGGPESAARTAAAIRDAFVAPIELPEIGLPVDMSIGGALWPEHGDSLQTLLRRADVAMCEAKRSNEGWTMYRAERDPFSLHRLALGAALRAAIGEGELKVFYQPILDLRTGHFSSAEALLRWEHPVHGRLLPGDFLDLAGQTGLMPAMTDFVLHSALDQCREWTDGPSPLAVCINLAPSALLDTHLPERIQRALERAGVEPPSLGLELTENGLLEEPHTALSILHALRDLGVRLAVDDYGTGYASLSYMRDLPVDSLKIDRSFVTGLSAGGPAAVVERNRAIVRSTVVLAHELHFAVVAEGVEGPGTLGDLQEMRVDGAQGYYIGEPVPAEAMAGLRRRWAGRLVAPTGEAPR